MIVSGSLYVYELLQPVSKRNKELPWFEMSSLLQEFMDSNHHEIAAAAKNCCIAALLHCCIAALLQSWPTKEDC
jgi:hypothetical protein